MRSFFRGVRRTISDLWEMAIPLAVLTWVLVSAMVYRKVMPRYFPGMTQERPIASDERRD